MTQTSMENIGKNPTKRSGQRWIVAAAALGSCAAAAIAMTTPGGDGDAGGAMGNGDMAAVGMELLEDSGFSFREVVWGDVEFPVSVG